MAGAGYGPWAPLGLDETVATFAVAPLRWWISGGRALELHLGRSWREHEDADVGIVRRELARVPGVLAGWELFAASDGRLSRWDGRAEVGNVWARRRADGPWELDVTVGDGDEQEWIYRRDPSVRRRWDQAVLRTADGIPYLAPELQLLFKSKAVRPKDEVDAREVIPALDPERRARLARLLPAGHPWQARLA